VQILELQRGRYVDGLLADADAWLGLYQGGQPLWSMGGLTEELANVAYASYYLIPVMVGIVALQRGPREATRLTAALTLASLMCGLVWLAFPSGGYHPGGSPQGPAAGPFTALVHALYAQQPHYAAAFPSEHVAHAVALAAVLRRYWGPWVWLWALGIALSTVVGQYHYAFDGLAGWAVGLAAATWVRQGGVEVVSAWAFRARAA
jgi:membrane-associated phospholipid phosphatase